MHMCIYKNTNAHELLGETHNYFTFRSQISCHIYDLLTIHHLAVIITLNVIKDHNT